MQFWPGFHRLASYIPLSSWTPHMPQAQAQAHAQAQVQSQAQADGKGALAGGEGALAVGEVFWQPESGWLPLWHR